jgi:flagellar secretion chaperone FliS
MSFSPNRYAQSYRHLGAETALFDADPHRVISLLFDAALDAIGRARHALSQRDVALRGQATSSAIRIIQEGLQASLNLSAGPLAANLAALYDYMTSRLVVANRYADDAILAEVAGLLQELRVGWNGIAPGRAPAPKRALGMSNSALQAA